MASAERFEGVPGDPFNTGRRQAATAGADIKYGVNSALTLTATINPDFGQVEADPAVVNLSVSDRDVVSLEPGLPVTVSTASRAEQYQGTIARVSPAADRSGLEKRGVSARVASAVAGSLHLAQDS